VRSCRVCGRVRVADGTTEEREHHERIDPERVVIELVGDLEGRTGVLERDDEPLLEARRPAEPAMYDGPQRRTRARLAQGFLEEGDRPAETLKLAEADHRLRTAPAPARAPSRAPPATRSRSSGRAPPPPQRGVPEPP